MADLNVNSYHQSGPPSQGIVQKEHSLHLYMHQNHAGPNLNQENLVSAKLFSTIWTLREGASPNSAIVGHVQGEAINCAGYWFHCQNIWFTDKSYNNSSIQIMGKYHGSKGEWGILGGTGEFACAQGVISYEVIQTGAQLNIFELHIRALCLTFPKPNPVIPVEKTELVGGKGGDAFDISEEPKRLESLTIRSGDVIDSIAFSYVDQAGNKKTAGPWGDHGGLPNTILFAPIETVNKVSGTIGSFGEHTVVTSLTIATNVEIYGPFGKEKGTPFSFPKENDKSVLGLFARAGLVVDAIGAYVGPSAAN